MSETTFVAYLRVSTNDQTTENQKLEISKKYNISKWFIDDNVSGSTPGLNRPALSSLLNYIRESDTLIISSLDRLGRNLLDCLSTIELLQQKNVALISLRENIDFGTPQGKLLLHIMLSFSEMEKSIIKERQLAGIQRCRNQGVHLGRKKTINDQEVAKWRYDSGASIRKTALHFNISTASTSRACRLYSKAS